MDLIEFFAELKSRKPELTVDSLGKIRQHGWCPLQIVFGHSGYIDIAQYEGLTCAEINNIIHAADYPDHPNLAAKEIRKRLLELTGD